MTKLSTIVVAAAAGFAAGVLLAPQSGEKTREELRAKTEEAKRRTENTVEKVRKAVTSETKSAKKKTA